MLFYEEREVDAAVPLLFLKIRMTGKRMLIPMLQDEIIAVIKDISLENFVWQRFQTLHRIRRISKNNIELFVADCQEIENIIPHHDDIVQAELGCLGLNESCVLTGHFNRIHLTGAP